LNDQRLNDRTVLLFFGTNAGPWDGCSFGPASIQCACGWDKRSGCCGSCRQRSDQFFKPSGKNSTILMERRMRWIGRERMEWRVRFHDATERWHRANRSLNPSASSRLGSCALALRCSCALGMLTLLMEGSCIVDDRDGILVAGGSNGCQC